jgi:hypothetical protein
MHMSLRRSEGMPFGISVTLRLLFLCSLDCCAMVWQGTASNDGRWQYLANFAYAVSPGASYAVHQRSCLLTEIFKLGGTDLVSALHCCATYRTQKGSGNFDIAALDREPDPGTQVSIACLLYCMLGMRLTL